MHTAYIITWLEQKINLLEECACLHGLLKFMLDTILKSWYNMDINLLFWRIIMLFERQEETRENIEQKLEITDERLNELLPKIKPLKVNKETAMLSYIEDVDPREVSYLMDTKTTEPAKGLIPFKSLVTYHSCGYKAFFKPSVAEVLAQIPEENVDETNAFFILSDDLDIRNCLSSGRHHAVKTILFKDSNLYEALTCFINAEVDLYYEKVETAPKISISNGELSRRLKKITPVEMSVHDDMLHYLDVSKINPRENPIGWAKEYPSPAPSLIPFKTINTYHPYGPGGFIYTPLAEVLAQIPSELVNDTVAYQTTGTLASKKNCINGYRIIKTILYKETDSRHTLRTLITTEKDSADLGYERF